MKRTAAVIACFAFVVALTGGCANLNNPRTELRSGGTIVLPNGEIVTLVGNVTVGMSNPTGPFVLRVKPNGDLSVLVNRQAAKTTGKDRLSEQKRNQTAINNDCGATANSDTEDGRGGQGGQDESTGR